MSARALRFLDAAVETAIHRGRAQELGWCLQRTAGERGEGAGYAAWLIEETPNTQVAHPADVDLHETPEEAADALLTWANDLEDALLRDVGW